MGRVEQEDNLPVGCTVDAIIKRLPLIVFDGDSPGDGFESADGMAEDTGFANRAL